MQSRLGRADIHIHTLASDGLSTAQEVVDSALAQDLDVIAVTDHNTVDCAYEVQELARPHGLDVVIGSEVSSKEGHILGLWITEKVTPGMSASDTVDAIHEQGGVAIVAHPYANKAFGKFGLESVGDNLTGLAVDGIEVYNSTPYMLLYANRLARKEFLSRNDTAALGGSDAHLSAAIGKGVTLFPGATAHDLRNAIICKKTDGVSGFASKLLTLSYIVKYRHIHKQQKVNLELCKPARFEAKIGLGDISLSVSEKGHE